MFMKDFVENKINAYAKKIIDGGERRDDHAMGELSFYMAFRRVLGGNATLQDVGMVDAINDVLQERGLVAKGKTFYK
ncbi:MAG: hypothetical protein FJ148_28700 [Deltaproteobacteria bacterium]|nr:hypothetical protein [Deltaproteobacteria bacterium]